MSVTAAAGFVASGVHAGELGNDTVGKDVYDVTLGVVVREELAEVCASRAHDAGGDEPAPDREQMRDERHREAEVRGDLRRVLVHTDAVRRDVLEDGACVRRRAQRSTGTRHPGLRVDDDAGRLDLGGDRRESEQHCSRVAAGIGDEPPRRSAQLREAVRPGRELTRSGMLEAVPLGVHVGIGEPVRAREIDDDSVYGRHQHCRPLVLEAAEDELRSGRERLLVGDERGQRPVQARVEDARGRACE